MIFYVILFCCIRILFIKSLLHPFRVLYRLSTYVEKDTCFDVFRCGGKTGSGAEPNKADAAFARSRCAA